MAKAPGPICQFLQPVIVDPGTLIRQSMLAPGPLLDFPDVCTDEVDEPTIGLAEPVSPLPGRSLCPWMEIAEGELSVTEIPGRKSNPRVVEYLNVVGQGANGDETAWCSAFANWCVEEAGLDGSGKPNARSWLAWGTALKEETYGAITVLWREKPDSWMGHVGFYVRGDSKHIMLLGGNQGQIGSVSIKAFPRSQLLGFRWPLGASQ